jgi:hypothetical protein
MTYEQAIAVRKRQIAPQPVDPNELATANRVIAHQRSMARAFGNDSSYTPPAPTAKPELPPARSALPPGCISVDEWLRTLPASESYQTKR